MTKLLCLLILFIPSSLHASDGMTIETKSNGERLINFPRQEYQDAMGYDCYEYPQVSIPASLKNINLLTEDHKIVIEGRNANYTVTQKYFGNSEVQMSWNEDSDTNLTFTIPRNVNYEIKNNGDFWLFPNIFEDPNISSSLKDVHLQFDEIDIYDICGNCISITPEVMIPNAEGLLRIEKQEGKIIISGNTENHEVSFLIGTGIFQTPVHLIIKNTTILFDVPLELNVEIGEGNRSCIISLIK